MITPREAVCTRCGGRIAWARTWVLEDIPKRREAKGMPINWPPVTVPRDWVYAPGPQVPNVAVSQLGAGIRARVLTSGQAPMADEVMTLSHFVTCPKRPGQPHQPELPLPTNVIVLTPRRRH